MQNKNYTLYKAWGILRGLYAFIVTEFILGWVIVLLMFSQRIKRQARTFVRAFF